jgi:threonine dehydratase
MVQTYEGVDRLRQLIRPTTIIQCDALDELTGAKIVLASETFQRTGSFKFRAAFNVAQNVQSQTLIAASSGNFGQALAHACQILGKKCIIVMPDNSMAVKVDAVKRYGGSVDLLNVSEKTRAQRVQELATDNVGSCIVSAFDDPFVIAGNATLGEELAFRDALFESIVVPVGGGGLISGIIRGFTISSCTKPIFGAEPLIANDAARSLQEGRIIRNEKEPQTIADGVRTLSLGEHNWRIIRDGVSGIIEVPEEKIVQAVKALFTLANLKVEPTGALSLAAVMTEPARFANKSVCCVVSGGNVDPAVLFKILGTN